VTDINVVIRPECFLRRKEVARRLGIHPETVYLWTKQGILPPSYRLSEESHNSPVGWKESQIQEFIDTRPQGSSPGMPAAWEARSVAAAKTRKAKREAAKAKKSKPIKYRRGN
jgi:predicted DNA-binding transcriptional regulator AlpA